MPANYPNSIVELVSPDGTKPLNEAGQVHSLLHLQDRLELIAIETELGTGLRGSLTSLSERLNVALNADGTFKSESITIESLSDVTFLSALSDGQLLRYNSSISDWVNWTPNYLKLDQTTPQTTIGTFTFPTIISSSTVTATDWITSTLLGDYPLDGNGEDVSGNARTITGGTYNLGYMSASGTLSTYVALYSACTSFVITGKFKVNDGSQSGATIFAIDDSTKQTDGSNLTTWFFGMNKDWIGSVNYDRLQLLVINNNTRIVTWESTATYNDNQWHSFAIRTVAGENKIWIDGVADAGVYTVGTSATTASPSVLSSSNRVSLCADDASLAQLKTYNVTRTDSQVASDLSGISSICAGMRNISYMGFNGNYDADYFLTFNGAWSSTPYQTAARGLIYYYHDSEYSTNGPTGITLIDLSSYRMDQSGNIFYKGVGIYGATGNYISYLTSSFNFDDYGASEFVTQYLSADNGLAVAQNTYELAQKIARGSTAYADNYGVIFGTGKDAQIYYDGTDLIINTKLVGTGKLNLGSCNFLTTGTLGAGAITGTSLIKSGGTSSEFLKADGSVDSSVYLTKATDKLTRTVTIDYDGSWNSEEIPLMDLSDVACTITAVRSSVLGSSTPTLTFNIEERSWGTDITTAGTVITSSAMTADADGTETTSFSNAGIAAKAHLVLTTGASAASGTVDAIVITIDYTKD